MLGKKSLRVGGPSSEAWGAHAEIDPRFHSLVERLTVEARQQPAAYRRRVVLAALIGYAFILAVVGLLLAIAAVSIVSIFYARALAGIEIKIAFIAAVVALGLLRSMAVAPYRPEGIEVTADDAPALFAMVDHVRGKVGGARIDTIYIDDELNASIAQPARFWLFGTRNVLTIGLPMMQALSEAELTSVVAHELGHSVGGHGRWAGFVYRVRVRWMQVADRLPNGLVAGLMRRFFNWYGPWFNAYSFVLARAQEYEADRVSARLATPAVAGSALIRMELQAQRMGDYWGRVWTESRHAEIPGAMPYGAMPSIFKAGDGPDDAWLAEALAHRTGLDDTHPCLADRLEALPASTGLPVTLERSAAETLLGDRTDQLVARFDSDWWENNGDWWRTRHSQAREEKEELERLKEVIDGRGARLRDHVRFIDLAAVIEGDEAAIAARRAALAAFPKAHVVRFQLGSALLMAGEEEGIGHIDAAILACPSLSMSGYRAIVEFIGASDGERQEHYLRLLEKCEANEPVASDESNSIDETWVLDPLQLEPAQRAELIDEIGRIDGLKWIAAGQRSLVYSGRQIVLVFTCNPGADASEVLDQLIDLMLDHADVLGLERNRSNAWLARKIEGLPNSVLLAR